MLKMMLREDQVMGCSGASVLSFKLKGLLMQHPAPAANRMCRLYGRGSSALPP